MKKIIATWSGGKDSCLAAYQVMQQGYHIKYLANTVTEKYKRVGFHGVKDIIIQKQAESIGIPLLQQPVDPQNYTQEFKNFLKRELAEDIIGVTFGDIHLVHCFNWANEICHELGVKAIEPLWKRKTESILQEFIQAGFTAIVVSTQGDLLGKEYLGRIIDDSFIHDLKKFKNIDLCGENGEYHTLVVDGPIFNKKIRITKKTAVFREGYWFLDIQEYQIIKK